MKHSHEKLTVAAPKGQRRGRPPKAGGAKSAAQRQREYRQRQRALLAATVDALDAGYAAMAQDSAREAEAVAWCNVLGGALNEAR